MKTVAEKMGITPGMKSILIQAPGDILQTIGLPQLQVSKRLTSNFDYIHFFAISQAHLRKNFPRLKKALAAGGKLWISWRKASNSQSDLSLPKVIEIGYDNGLVESKTLSIDDTWSAMKFTHPIPGRVYNNSYGKLK